MSDLVTPIISQGLVVTNKVIYTPKALHEGVITNIKIANTTTPCTITLSRYIKSTNSISLLYEMDLDAGDTLNDDTEYKIKSLDYLYLEVSTNGTTFAVSGLETLSA